GGILEAVVQPRAALDPVVAGELVPGEKVRLIEHEALGVFVGLDSGDDLIRPDDKLADRRDRLRAPGRAHGEGIAVFEADAGHAAGEGALVTAGEEGRLTRIGDRARSDRA